MNQPTAMTTEAALGLPPESDQEASLDVAGLTFDQDGPDEPGVGTNDFDPDAVEDSSPMSAPDCIVPPDPESKDTRLIVEFYSSDCLDCNSLVQNADEDGLRKKCHHSQGNAYCPARELRVEFSGARVFWLRKVQKAQESTDRGRLIKVLSDLNEQADAVTRDRVMALSGL